MACENMKKLHQFYYTNYGRGYRIEASSIPDLDRAGSVVSAIQALAGIWETSLSGEGTETVSFSEKLGRFAAARTVPCRQPGDSRPGFWSHVIIPEKDGSDGFAACLSWPEENWETDVRLGESLTDAVIPEKEYDLTEICRKYGLGRERLAQLILLAVRSASGVCQPVRLVCTDCAADVCIKTAREMMALIYNLLPDTLRSRAGYQAPAEKTGASLCFYFCKPGTGQGGFSLDPHTEAEPDHDVLAQEMGLYLAELFETDCKEYRKRICLLYGSPDEDFETMLWNHYRQQSKQELESLPQDLLYENASRLLQAAEYDTGLAALTENWFAAVRVDALDSRLAGFTELSLQEAQLLRNSSGKDYRRCILRCRKLLSELSHDEDTLQENLSIISGQYPAIAKDLSGDFSEPDPETESETDQKKGPVRKKSSNHKRKQKSVVFSILFAGCYLALVMSLCGLFTQLARQQQNPALFVGGIAAVIAGGFLLMILNAVTDLLRREQHISMNGIFMAGVILTVIAAIAAAAGFPAAAIVSGAGTVISGAILTHR